MDKPAIMHGDNMSVVLNTTVPSSVLKKKHNSIAYHRVRECIAAKIVKFFHIDSIVNVADVLTKPLGNLAFHRLVYRWLFRTSPNVEQERQKGEDEEVIEDSEFEKIMM